MSVNEKVLDAAQLLINNIIKKAEYDKTIQAQIISCEDATIGKYRCRYQDTIIYAYTNTPDIIFNNGSYVYILVPGGDMKNPKTILGTTKKLGINYISQAEGDQAYDVNGNNCITSNNIFYLNTENKDYKYTLYKYNETNEIGLDIVALEQYLKQSSSLIIGGVFKTSIPPERQYRGHYGITFNLRFLDNTSTQQVIRSYIIDEDNMVDNPYRLAYETRQYQIFNIDGPNFIRVESIEIFNKDFPGADKDITDIKLTQGDIQINNLELSGATRMSESEISGVSISFFTPQGTFFTDSSTSASYKTITAQVRVKGKLVSSAQNIPFYWGIEHVGISPSSEYYNKYLGRGWKCLNDKNIIEEGTETSDPVIEWVPSKDTYILKFDDATARDNKIKVAIVYDTSVVTKTINIQNLNMNTPVLTIESSGGTQFYYDIGHPTLTCTAKINDQELTGCSYYWAYENSSGIFEDLPETTELNAQYDQAVAALESLKAEIAAGTEFLNSKSENLNDLETAVKAFNFIQRVRGNKIYDVQINRITSFGTFKCSVYNDRNIYLGTTSITLTNVLEGESLYSLVINNGSAVFQYNENGVAPNNKSLDVQQQIQGLSFTIYDNLGQPVDSDIIINSKDCKIRWQFPIQDTLLTEQEENEPNAGTDATQTYKYYDNKTNLVYGIAQKYDISKRRNQIRLTVDYKGMSLTAETNFTFAKQGQPGTNGTEYIVKLIPNTRMNNPPLWPMITKAGSDYILNYGLGSSANQTIIGADVGSDYQLFRAQLWHSGELVWEGMQADPSKAIVSDGTTYPTLVHWEVLKNKYNKNIQDNSAFIVRNAATGKIQYTGDNLQSAIDTPLANIIKCSITVQGKTYYGTIPITTAWTVDENYRVNLKDYTGFRYVLYTSDGVNPQYDDSNPFEFICMEKINDIWEDVSLVKGGHAVTYVLAAIGNYLSLKDGTATNSNLLTILTSEVYRDKCEKNQWIARPALRYDGTCVNEAICCIYRQNDRIVGRINIPIHYLLNKYGMAHINEWDGNSVQINEDGGFILAPQMGAGKKDNNNNFTGVLMGQVRNIDKSNPDIGLLGYSDGERTFFLNSENGSALFGKTGVGQIIIDPYQDKALLYSGNFWNSYDENGLPENYNERNINTEDGGLLIDLTTPQIRYANGNFSVDKDGLLNAKNATIEGNIIAKTLQLKQSAMIGVDDISGLDQKLSGINADQQMIYKLTNRSTLSKSDTPAYWLDDTKAEDTQDAPNIWTLIRPTYNKNYPNLFISIQKKNADGDITCTTPLQDKSLTVIDGGHITTGQIDASDVNIYNLNADNINSGHISANYIYGGTLKLGGNNNTNGVLQVYDSSGSQVGTWNNTGLSATGNLTISVPGYSSNGKIIANIASFNIIDNSGQLNGLTSQQTVYGMRVYSYGNSRNAFLYLIPITGSGLASTGVLSSGNLTLASQASGTGANSSIFLGSGVSRLSHFSAGGTGYKIQLDSSNIYVGYGQSSSGSMLFTATGSLSRGGASGTFNGYLTCVGGKQRLIQTKSYGSRLHSCYEMTSPMFGDIGSGQLDENGVTIIDIDDIFYETVRTSTEYQVFLQAEGRGELWVSEKHENYFIVEGTPNLKFSWELKAKQIDMYNNRLEDYVLREQSLNHNDDLYDVQEAMLLESLDQYISEMEDIYEVTQQFYGT